MFCNRCGNNMGNNEAFCNRCGAANPMFNNRNVNMQDPGNNINQNYQNRQNYTNNQMNVNKKVSALSIWALILSIIGCTSFIGIILAIIDLTNKDGKKKTLSICALVISALFIFISILFLAIPDNSDTESTNNDTVYEESQEEYEEPEQEIIETEEIEETETTEVIEETADPENQEIEEIEETEEIEEVQEETAMTKSSYAADCLEYNYKSIARNPDDCIGNKYYGEFEVFSKQNGSLFSDYDICYKCYDADYNFIYVIDRQDKESEDYINVLEGDTIIVYGQFNGMVQSKNYLNNSISDEVCLDMYYCDLIEE